MPKVNPKDVSKPDISKMCDRCKENHQNGFISWIEKDPDGFDIKRFSKCNRYPCEKYPEEQKRRMEYLARSSGIPFHYQDKTVKEFVADTDVLKSLKAKIIKYAFNCDSDNFRCWLYLAGQTGCGKTHLSCAVGMNLIRKGKRVKMYCWPDLMRMVKNFQYDEFEIAKSVEVLILDDLYKGNPTEEEKKRTFELINFRQTNGLQTIVTTERENREMMDIDSAIIGRIIEACDGFWAYIPKDVKVNNRLKEFLK